MHKDLIADYLIGMWVGIFLWLIIFAIIYFPYMLDEGI